MKEQILDFIRRRWRADCNWVSGNCYWFAHILLGRFPQLELYYYPIDNHFVVGDGTGAYYDWTGVVDQSLYSGAPLLWSEMDNYDTNVKNRVIRDCIL